MTQDGCVPNEVRGGGCYWGPDVTEDFLNRHNLQLIIRSHECKQEGYEFCHNRKVSSGTGRGVYIVWYSIFWHVIFKCWWAALTPGHLLHSGPHSVLRIQLLRCGQQPRGIRKAGPRSCALCGSVPSQQHDQRAQRQTKVRKQASKQTKSKMQQNSCRLFFQRKRPIYI